MDMVLEAVLRKGIFALMLLFFLIGFDVFYLRGFKTWEELKGDPKAIAILLGCYCIAVSLA